MKKISLMLLSIAFVTTGFASSTTTLRFATNATYPPFVSVNDKGQMIGFGIDVVNALCQQMKVKCEITDTAWDSLIPALMIGKYDAIFGGLSITKKRAKVVDFTKPYYKNAATFIINKDKPLTLTQKGMQGKVIGYQQGNTFGSYITSNYGTAVKLKAYPSPALAFMDLKAGRINALILDRPVAVSLLKAEKTRQYVTQGQLHDQAFGIGNGIAVKKGNTILQNQLNQAIDRLEENGTLTKLTYKWFN
ncbi:transporter substrate-binding domain-containing protein [Facilibium subflavum]|uniref:transporter substrate-binding domain-containing protein n=1 Tax=Facilibium subflavum TaxID=2219058 RepID=UPI000E65BE83|nr:transporter substrate-binding domain-containing protein [Facilibium subflavum]